VTSQVRVENLPTPGDYIPRVMEKVRPLYLQRTYEIASWTDPLDFLTKLAIRSGKLLRVHLFFFFFKKSIFKYRVPRLLMIWWW
jgi:hypothetical protein